jgi:hypothetical protein
VPRPVRSHATYGAHHHVNSEHAKAALNGYDDHQESPHSQKKRIVPHFQVCNTFGFCICQRLMTLNLIFLCHSDDSTDFACHSQQFLASLISIQSRCCSICNHTQQIQHAYQRTPIQWRCHAIYLVGVGGRVRVCTGRLDQWHSDTEYTAGSHGAAAVQRFAQRSIGDGRTRVASLVGS